MDDFVAVPSPWRIAFLLLLAAGFVAMGLWMAGLFGPVPSSDRYSPLFVTGMGWVAVIFFGFCGIVGARRLFDRTEQLRVGRDGIRSAPWSEETVPWSAITEVTTWSHHGQTMIILHLRDPARYPARGMAAMLARANRSLTGGDIAISLTGTNRKIKDALAAIARFRAAA